MNNLTPDELLFAITLFKHLFKAIITTPNGREEYAELLSMILQVQTKLSNQLDNTLGVDEFNLN